jgi:hypothetical protein
MLYLLHLKALWVYHCFIGNKKAFTINANAFFIKNIGEVRASITAINCSFFVFLSGFSIVVFAFFAVVLPL